MYNFVDKSNDGDHRTISGSFAMRVSKGESVSLYVTERSTGQGSCIRRDWHNRCTQHGTVNYNAFTSTSSRPLIFMGEKIN